MTHTENIKRIKVMAENYKKYFFKGIEDLENRIEELEAKLEVSKQLKQ